MRPEEIQEALSPETSQERLRALYNDAPALHSSLVQNPNTPLDVLFLLGEKHPQALLENPSFSLYFLENPSGVEKIPVETLLILVRLEELPGWLSEAIATHASLDSRRKIASNPWTPLAWLERLSKDPQEEVRQWLALNPSAPESLLMQLCQQSNVREYIARNHALSPQFFELLSRDPSAKVRASVARNKETPLPLLEKLAQDPDASVSSIATESLEDKKRQT